VRLQGEKLKNAIAESGVDEAALVAAIERTGLRGASARSALRNWIAGRDHPRCKASDVARLAQACGVSPRDLVRFESRVMHHRGSTQKARLVVDLVRGKPVDEAMNLLSFSPKRAAVNVKKALTAAVADAELADADVTRLVVTDVRVDEGPHIKRFRPKDRGRAHAILKRTSHITVGVEERN